MSSFPRVKSAGLRGAKAVGNDSLSRVKSSGLMGDDTNKFLSIKPVELEPTIHELTGAIEAISDGMRKLRESRLSDKAILLLLSHSSGIGQRDVQRVLDALANLGADYLKPIRFPLPPGTGPR